MATGQKSTNPLFGLMPAPKSGIVEAGVNALQSLGLLRPKTSDISYMTADPNKPTILGSKEAQNLKKSYQQVQKQKTQYATKELPKRADKAAKQINKFYDDLVNNPDYADRADEIKQVKQQVLKQVNDQALIKQQTALTDTDPSKINQFGIKKAQTDIKKATEQPLTKQDKAISTRGNAFIRTGEGLLGGVNKFAQDVSLAAQALGNPVQQAVENIPFIKNTQQAYINDVNKKLDNANISADERINLLKQKSFLEANSKTANKVLRSGELPTALEQIQNTQLGEDVAKGYRNTGLYKTGEFVGKEVLPLVAAPETGLGTQAAKMVAKTGIGKALTKYGGGKATELFVKGAVENAIQEQPIGAIQEAARVATGEQTALEALGNQVKRTALAGSLGGVADLGLGAAGRVFDDKIGAPLARARKFKDLQQQRAAVQGERIARDADIEEVQNALLDLNQRKAAEDFAPSFKDKIAEKTQKQTVKEVNAVIQETEKTIKQTAKEEQAVQNALEKLEKNNVKAEDLQYKQEANLGKQTVKGVNEAINDVQTKFAREELQARKAEIIARKEKINTLKTELREVQAGRKQGAMGEKYTTRNIQRIEKELGALKNAETDRLALSQAKRTSLQSDLTTTPNRPVNLEKDLSLSSYQNDGAFIEARRGENLAPSGEKTLEINPIEENLLKPQPEPPTNQPRNGTFQEAVSNKSLQAIQEPSQLTPQGKNINPQEKPLTQEGYNPKIQKNINSFNENPLSNAENLAQGSKSIPSVKSLDDTLTNKGTKTETLEPQGLKATEKDPKVKEAHKETKQAFREALDNGSEMSNLPMGELLIRSGIEDNQIKGLLGKFDKEATFHKLTPEAQDKVVDFLAAKELRGELSADARKSILETFDGENLARGSNSNALSEAKTQKFVEDAETLESQALEEKALKDLKRATTPEELEEIANKNPDAFSYDENGKPSKFAEAYEKRELEITGSKERGLITTIKNNPNISDELKKKIAGKYEVRSTKDLFERASEKVKTQDSESLAKEIRAKARQEGNWTDEEVATGYELARKYEAEGLLDEAAEIEEALAKKATEGGQMIQAYAKYGKTTPEGAIREANKVLENAMPKAKAKQLKEATNNLIKEFTQVNKKAIEDILNFCPPGSFT